MEIKSRRLGWVGHITRMEEGGNGFKILTGKPTEKRSLEIPRSRWQGNIRMDLKAINTRNRVGSAEDRDVCRTCKKGIQPA